MMAAHPEDSGGGVLLCSALLSGPALHRARGTSDTASAPLRPHMTWRLGRGGVGTGNNMSFPL